MGYYPGDDEEKAERARARERERQETERAEAAAKRRARRCERAERLRAAGAAWDEASGAEQTRMLLFGAGRLLWRAVPRAWRWLFTEPSGFVRDSEGRMRDAVSLAVYPLS